ncbi:unnamed protein product [Kuraishia capsulata CBS 1993]|uniref:Uncharacterized protein n=1 Tax=Kuraishia capsulata CBS 1993 TaxID=1382522 RepID=W6MV63_9ASCO|nr:uncharacterized protein KUCA_T00002061001 [Kuraishia capsulata CBS 1993]CDK26090.1 unnamed protein product [Kuraishia capsulata CBS 1993]
MIEGFYMNMFITDTFGKDYEMVKEQDFDTPHSLNQWTSTDSINQSQNGFYYINNVNSASLMNSIFDQEECSFIQTQSPAGSTASSSFDCLPPKIACDPERRRNTIVDFSDAHKPDDEPKNCLMNLPLSDIPLVYESYSSPHSISSRSSQTSNASPRSSHSFPPHAKREQANKCHICAKLIRRDMSRHLRIHNPISRFQCYLPRDRCNHKTGQFNRPYDFKKHMLNSHFQFDDSKVKKMHNLNDKLNKWGNCECGFRANGEVWLENHFLTNECLVFNQFKYDTYRS